MNPTELKTLLSSSGTKTFKIDPKHRDNITKETLNEVQRTVKKSIAAKRTVTIVVASE